jgi:lantibiotic modifying enzyme
MDKCTHGNEDAFKKLLIERGMTLDQARKGLAEVRVKKGSVLPTWAMALRDLLQSTLHMPPTEHLDIAISLTSGGILKINGDAKIPVNEGIGAYAIAPFAAVAYKWIDPGITRLKSSSLSKYDINGIATSLVRYLEEQILHAILRCLLTKPSPNFHDNAPTFDEWTILLRKYPALGRVLGILAVQWRDFSEELLTRLYADAEELNVTLQNIRPEKSVHFSSNGTGDRHDGGRFVVPIDYGNGKILLYKPKDLRLGGSLNHLIDSLGLDLQLPRRLEHGDYIWEEVVNAHLPVHDEQWDALAKEIGMWACLFTVLGSTDMLKCNVIISGEHIVPVDTETIIPFLFLDPDTIPWIPAATNIGLLNSPILSKNNVRLGNWGILADPNYMPLHERIDLIQEGYSTMYSHIANNKDKVLKLISNFSELPVRAVMRNTWVYLHLLMDSLAPEALVNGIERDLVLERLWRAQQRFSLSVSIVEAELSSLRDMDVPLFRFYPGKNDMVTPGGGIATNILFEPPLESIYRHITEMTNEPPAADMDSLTALAFCALPDYPVSVIPNDRTNTTISSSASSTWTNHDISDPPHNNDWLSKAHQISLDLYNTLNHGGPTGDRLHANVCYVPTNSVFVLSPVRGGDLLSGSAGIANVLCHLAYITENDLLIDEATFHIDCSIKECLHLSKMISQWSGKQSELPDMTFYTGLPTLLYALASCNLQLSYIRPHSTLCEEIDEAIYSGISAIAGLDIKKAFSVGNWLKIGPVSSMLISLSSILTMTRTEDLAGTRYSYSHEQSTLLPALADLSTLTMIEETASNLARLITDKWGNYFPDLASSVIKDLYPSDKTLASLALSRYYHYVVHTHNQGNKLPPTPLNVFPEQIIEWLYSPDTDISADNIITTSLKSLLSASIPDIATKTVTHHILSPDIYNSSGTTLKSDSYPNHDSNNKPTPTLSYLNQIEYNLISYRLYGNDQCLDAARSAGIGIMKNRNIYGRYFPENHLPDRYRLSAIWGLAGIAHAISGLADPNSWFSLRLLETPKTSRNLSQPNT